MSRKPTKKPEDENQEDAPRVPLHRLLSVKPKFHATAFWIEGTSPLICHAWSHKARLSLLGKQVGATERKAARDPEEDFRNSLYEMEPGSGVYGFPVTAIKKGVILSAHKNKGIARTDVMSSLWFHADIVASRPALKDAVCDLPLVRIYGSDPVIREDMVRVGAGIKKTATLAYRAQFSQWAIRVGIRWNPKVLNETQLATLINEAGMIYGLGDWRNEKFGVFGAYQLAWGDRHEAWEAYANGSGPLPPQPDAEFAMAAE